MKNIIFKAALISIFIVSILIPFSSAEENTQYNNMIESMKTELARSMKDLKLENNDPPFYIDYIIECDKTENINYSLGSEGNSGKSDLGSITVRVKMGNYEDDEIAYKKDIMSFDFSNFMEDAKYLYVPAPADLNPLAARYKLWYITDHKYKKSVDLYTKKKQTKALDVEDEQKEKLPSFTKSEPYSCMKITKFKEFDLNELKDNLKKLSAEFRNIDEIMASSVKLQVNENISFYVNSEGSEGYFNSRTITISCSALTILEDGNKYSDSMKIILLNNDNIPGYDELKKEITLFKENFINYCKNAKDLDTDYIGPVIFSAGSSGKFFYRNISDLIKGSRKNQEQNILVLEDFIDKKVLASGIDIIDNPELTKFNGKSLPVFYMDLEGIKPEKTIIFKDGKFKNFLMTRVPITNFPKSNGHAFSSEIFSNEISPDITNLIISSTKAVSYNAILTEFKKLCREAELENGIIIEGSNVYLYNIKTEKKELLKNLKMGRTSPLHILKKVKFVCNDPEIFFVAGGLFGDDFGALSDFSFLSGMFGGGLGSNGTVIAPSILVTEFEFKKESKQNILPPILPPPGE